MQKIEFDKNIISNEIVSCATLIKVLTLRSFVCADIEITPEQFVILDAVVKNEKIYQRQLGELLGKDRPNIARLVGILEKKELIKKSIDSNGRQINRITITKKGEELRNKILPEISKIRQSYLDNIELDELIKCYEILNKIKNNISQNTKLQT